MERDFAMFLGLEKEVNLVVDNSEGADINDVVKEILDTERVYER